MTSHHRRSSRKSCDVTFNSQLLTLNSQLRLDLELPRHEHLEGLLGSDPAPEDGGHGLCDGHFDLEMLGELGGRRRRLDALRDLPHRPQDPLEALALTEALAEELKGKDVRVNAVLPSVIDTPANREDMPDADVSAWVTTGEIAKVIAFLLSSDSSGVTGASEWIAIGTPVRSAVAHAFMRSARSGPSPTTSSSLRRPDRTRRSTAVIASRGCFSGDSRPT